MEELPGTPFYGFALLEIEELCKVWARIANILNELKKYPFARIGSLILNEVTASALGQRRPIELGLSGF
ncbi:hypothetical protein BDD12DRAFT_834327 [Trichophaea hybrida]|nr:hypothetical protein BDD12DRAFT_834327 [Trichophaea hybrida]